MSTYEQILSDAEKQRQDILQQQQDMQRYIQDVKQQQEQLRKARYTSSPAEQLYQSRQLKEMEKQLTKDSQVVRDSESEIQEALGKLKEYEDEIRKYKSEGYDVEETDEGLRFTKEKPITTTTTTRTATLSKSDFLKQDYRPAELMDYVSKTAFGEALWQIQHGASSAMAGNIKLYRTASGGISYSKPHDVTYKATVTNPEWQRLQTQANLILKQIQFLVRAAKMKNISPMVQKTILSQIKRLKSLHAKIILQRVRTPRTITTTQTKTIYPTSGESLGDIIYQEEKTIGQPEVIDWKNVLTGETLQSSLISEYKEHGVPSEFMSKVGVPSEYEKIGISQVQLASMLYERDVLKTTTSKQFEDFVIGKGVKSFKETGAFPFFFDPDKHNPPVGSMVSDKEHDKLIFFKKYDEEFTEEDYEGELEKHIPPISRIPLQIDTSKKSPVVIMGVAPEKLSTVQFLTSSYAGGTAPAEMIPGHPEFEMALGKKMYGDEYKGMTDIELRHTYSTFIGKGDPLSPSPAELKKHTVGYDIGGKPITIPAFAPYHDFTAKDTDYYSIISEYQQHKTDVSKNIAALKSNIEQLEKTRDSLKDYHYKTILYDATGSGEMVEKPVSWVKADIEQKIKEQYSSLASFEKQDKKLDKQIEGLETAHKIGYALRKVDDTIEFEEPVGEFYEYLTGSAKPTVKDMFLYGDWFLKPAGAKIWGAIKGQPSVEATEREIMLGRVDFERMVGRAEYAGRGVATAKVVHTTFSPGGQTAIIVAGSFGLGKLVGAVGKFAGAKLKATKLGAFAGAKIAPTTAKMGVVPGLVLKGTIYTGIAVLQIPQVVKTWEAKEYAAPGELTSHFVRLGLSMGAFRKGMSAGIGKPAVTTVKKDVKVIDPSFKEQVTSFKQYLSDVKAQMWAKHPKLMGHGSVVVGKMGDVGRHVTFQTKQFVSHGTGIVKDAYYRAWSSSHALRILERGVRADIKAFTHSEKFKGLTQAFTKYKSGDQVVYPSKKKPAFDILADKKGIMRDLKQQFISADDVNIVTQDIYKTRGLHPDIFKFRYGTDFNIISSHPGDIKQLTFASATGKGYGFVEKEIYFFKNIKGDLDFIIRPSGKVVTFGTSVGKIPETGRFVKSSVSQVFDFVGKSKTIPTPGLVDIEQPSSYSKFVILSKAQKRGATDFVRSIGIAEYTPMQDKIGIVTLEKHAFTSSITPGKLFSTVSKDLGFSTEYSIAAGKMGKITMTGIYTPPKGFERAFFTLKGTMVHLPKDAFEIASYTVKPGVGYSPHSLIQNIDASLVLTKPSISFVSKHAEYVEKAVKTAVVSGIGSSVAKISHAIYIPETYKIAKHTGFTFSPLVMDMSREETAQVSSSAMISKFDFTDKYKIETAQRTKFFYETTLSERAIPVFKTELESYKDLGIKQKAGFIQGFDFKQVTMQKQKLRLKMDIPSVLNITPIFAIPVVAPPPQPPSPPPPVFPPPSKTHVAVTKKKTEPYVFKRRPMVMMGVKKKVLAQPFRVMRMQAKYGRATHPYTTKKMLEYGYKTGFDIPTVEEMKEFKMKKTGAKGKKKPVFKHGKGKTKFSFSKNKKKMELKL